MKGIAQIIVCASFGNRFCKYMPGHQTNKPESLQNNASSINQYWKAMFMWWTLEEPDQWTGNGCFIFPLRLPRDSCSSCVLHKMPYSPCLAHKAPVLQATFAMSWLSIDIYLENQLCSSKIFLEFDFARKRDKLVANMWEHEIGREIVRLTTKSWDLARRSVLNI